MLHSECPDFIIVRLNVKTKWKLHEFYIWGFYLSSYEEFYIYTSNLMYFNYAHFSVKIFQLIDDLAHLGLFIILRESEYYHS